MPKLFILKTVSFTIFLLLAALTSGCASKSASTGQPLANPLENAKDTNSQLTTESGRTAMSLVALDFARVLAQIPDLKPQVASLSIVPDSDGNAAFAEVLRTVLSQEGYSVEIDSSDDSRLDLAYRIRKSNDLLSADSNSLSSANNSVYQLSVGNVSLRRLYSQAADGRIMPVTPMEGRGLEGAEMIVDDSIFSIAETGLLAEADTQQSSDIPVDSPDSAILPPQSGGASADDTSKLASEASEVAPETTDGLDAKADSTVGDSAVAGQVVILDEEQNTLAEKPASQSNNQMPALAASLDTTSEINDAPMQRMPFEDTVNFKDLGMSNHHADLDKSFVVDMHVLNFGNNSSVITPDAKAKLQLMFEKYEASSNFISVVGASHGKAPYQGAQEALARARAMAVRNALVVMGLSADRILAEASWSETYYDEVMPRRGAVVQVRRPVALSAVN